MPEGALGPRVSYHAVARYIERFVGITLENDFSSEREKALAHCEAAGLSLDEVNELVLTPAATLAIRHGFPRFSTGGVAYIVAPVRMLVVTVIKPRPNGWHFLDTIAAKLNKGGETNEYRSGQTDRGVF